MATTIYFRDAAAPTHRGDNSNNTAGNPSPWVPKAFATTRGAGLVSKVTNTVTGTTTGVDVTDTAGGNPLEWISEPVDADFTMSGSITYNLWSLENNMSANVAINAVVYKLAADGTLTLVDQTARVTELGLTAAAANFSKTPAAGVAFNKGDRILVRIVGDDAGTMNTGFTFTFGYNGPTASANGDSFVTFTETFGFLTAAPTGTQLFLTESDAFADSLQDTGWKSPGTVDGAGWTNHGNVIDSDDIYATCVQTGGAGGHLSARNFGFNLPSNVVIREIRVEVEMKNTVPGNLIFIRLQNDTGALAGSQMFCPVQTTDGVWILDPNNMLADLRPTPSMVNSSNFGVQVWPNDSTTQTVSVDQIRMKITYALTARPKLMSRIRGTFGTGAGSQQANGWVSPRQYTDGAGQPGRGTVLEWYSRKLSAFTLGGLITCNLRAARSGGFCGTRAELAICDQDGTSAVIVASGCSMTDGVRGNLVQDTQTAEIFNLACDDISVLEGQRLRLRVYLEDTSDTAMGAENNTASLFYNGPTGGTNGDSWIQLTQSVTEYTEPKEPLKQTKFIHVRKRG